jgi:hypothetical protein
LIDSGLKSGFVNKELENEIIEMERLKSNDFRTLFLTVNFLILKRIWDDVITPKLKVVYPMVIKFS